MMLPVETQEKIQALVRESLPSIMADDLVAVLEKAKATEADYKVASEELKEKTRDLVSSQAYLSKATDELTRFNARESYFTETTEALDKRDISLQLREAVIKLREEHANDKVAGLHGVVMAVFGNNRYKYERTTTAPVVLPATPGISSNDAGYGSVPPIGPRIEDGKTVETGEGES